MNLKKSRYYQIFLISVLCVCYFVLLAAGRSIHASTEGTKSWENNVLKEDHGTLGLLEEDGIIRNPVRTAFGVPGWSRENIQAIYILDSLDDMPNTAIDLSEAGDKSVMGWLVDGRILFIAGNGGVKAPKDCSSLFAWYENAKVIDLDGNLHTDDSTDFQYMFYHCYKAEQINLTGLNTEKVVSFSKMFAYCQGITELDFSSFDTSSSDSFYQMFNHCDSLKRLDLSTFSLESARTLALMFYYCVSLEEIIFSPDKFDTSHVKRMTDLFLGCGNLSLLDVSWFQMGEVTSVKNMFMGCRKLPVDMDLTGWDMKSVEEHDGMFAQSSLEIRYGSNGEYFFRFKNQKPTAS